MHENGTLSIVGRSKDMIVRGGENIYPTEIEQFLIKHAEIQDVYVRCLGLKFKKMETYLTLLYPHPCPPTSNFYELQSIPLPPVVQGVGSTRGEFHPKIIMGT
jgi:hypothetical protein